MLTQNSSSKKKKKFYFYLLSNITYLVLNINRNFFFPFFNFMAFFTEYLLNILFLYSINPFKYKNKTLNKIFNYELYIWIVYYIFIFLSKHNNVRNDLYIWKIPFLRKFSKNKKKKIENKIVVFNQVHSLILFFASFFQ